jgi:hypothetical protein
MYNSIKSTVPRTCHLPASVILNSFQEKEIKHKLTFLHTVAVIYLEWLIKINLQNTTMHQPSVKDG